MTSGNTTGWRTLLDDNKAAFQAGGDEIPLIPDEPRFVVAFETLCREHRQLYYTRLLSGLKLNRTAAFARAVDRGCQHVPPNTLAARVYGGTFLIVKRLWNDGCDPHSLVRSLADLHSSFPLVDAESVRLLHEYEAFNVLHHLFNIYCDALVKIVARVSHEAVQDQKEILQHAKEIILEKVAEIQIQSSSYLKALEAAARHKKQIQMQIGKIQVNGVYSKQDATAHYISVQALGRGTFGDVDEVEAASGGARYARKRISFYADSAASGHEKEVLNEILIMEKLRHQHIVSVRFWLQEDNLFSIFMKPVADCNLLSFLKQCRENGHPEASTRQIYSWFGCLLDGLNFAHRRDIIHRDIKPTNILIEKDQIYLADFGSAKDISGRNVTLSKDYFVYGTPVYRAPETQAGQAPQAPADIFSLGCVFSEMLTVANSRPLADFQTWRKAPQNECGPNAFRANLPKVRSWLAELESDALPPVARALILNMVKENPASRASAKDGLKLLASEEELFFCQYH